MDESIQGRLWVVVKQVIDRRACLLLPLALCAWAPAADAGEQTITPAHVYQALGKLNGDINLIRVVMGRPVLTGRPWGVENAEPRHVFYQAQTLFRKVSALAGELAGAERKSPPPAKEDDMVPADVLALILSAQAEMDTVRKALGIALVAETPALQPGVDPSDVLRETVQASRQLNLMLDRQFKPEDVFDRLVLASAYVAGALTDDVAEPQYGSLPPLEAAKLPADVYRRVMECLQLTDDIGAKKNIPVLKLNLRQELRRKDIAPADVYDLATTVLSELAHLTLALNAKDVEPPEIPRPRNIFPSHVYQVAGMLQDQLALLEESL